MSRRKNVREFIVSGDITNDDQVIIVNTASLVLDLPEYDGTSFPDDNGINLKDSRYFLIYTSEDLDLSITDGVSLFNINATNLYTVSAKTGLAVWYYYGFWFIDQFDITASGGGSVNSVTGTAPNISITGTAADPIVNAGQNSWEFPNSVTTATLSNDQDDYTQAGLEDAVVLRVISDNSSPAVITGIDGGTDGRLLIVQNVGTGSGAGPLFFSNENGGSLAANRIIFTKGTQEVPLGATAYLVYNSARQRWILLDCLYSVAVDGVTITGDGTSQAPLVAVPSAGTPASPTGSVQFNNAGVFGGNADLTWDNTLENLGIGTATPLARLHLPAGTAAANTGPLRLTTGTSLTTAVAGMVEMTTDNLFWTITTGTARKRLLMADAVGGLTSARVPFATTNGRLTDSANMTYATNRLSPTYITTAANNTGANTSPWKMTTGALMTTAEAGAWEYSSPLIYFTNGALSTQRQKVQIMQHAVLGTRFDKTASITLSTITSLTANMAAGGSYSFDAWLHFTADAVGGFNFGIGGTGTATAITAQYSMRDNIVNNSFGRRMITLGAIGGSIATTEGFMHIQGFIRCQNAGTFEIQFAQSVASGTSSVIEGSTFKFVQM